MERLFHMTYTYVRYVTILQTYFILIDNGLIRLLLGSASMHGMSEHVRVSFWKMIKSCFRPQKKILHPSIMAQRNRFSILKSPPKKPRHQQSRSTTNSWLGSVLCKAATCVDGCVQKLVPSFVEVRLLRL